MWSAPQLTRFTTLGCNDGLGTNALLNRPTAVTVTPNGERLMFLDSDNHVVREYRLAPPDQFVVRYETRLLKSNYKVIRS